MSHVCKYRERWLLDKFLTRLSLSPSKIIEREKPDFEIEIGAKRTGVEVTEYSSVDGGKSKAEQKQESYRQEIQRHINQKMQCNAIGERKIEISFGLINKPINRIVDDIISCLPNDLQHSGYIDIPYKLKDIFKYIRVDLGNLSCRTGLFYSQAYDLHRPLNASRLEDIIKEKKRKFTEYQKFDENWLIVTFDRVEPAFDACLPIDISSLNNLSAAPFDKIFLYRTYESDPILIVKDDNPSKL